MPPPIRVAVVGDSISARTNYPAELQKLLGPRYKVGKFGVPGTTVIRRSESPYIDQPALKQALAFRPRVIVIMLGTNDVAGPNYRYLAGFPKDYRVLISRFQRLPHEPQIWLASPPPIVKNRLGLSDDRLVHEVLPRIKQIAGELGLPLIDVYSTMSGHPEYFRDGVHPNRLGSRVIAAQIRDAVLRDYAGRPRQASED